ncbi:transposase [Leptospira santarosai]|uniref:transposase n=1 Tax=Leptospira santarosai TaxID=28183 RepID=UPI000518EF8B|nr:transposase [Leptospira santarosai]MDI7157149.1 transposase [Leptospira santarosai]MDI7182799.1 transposase [Leptospira santarosai]
MATTTRYSEAFKRKVILSIEDGKYNQTQTMKHYGIKGSVTVRGWLKKYGKNHLIGKIVRVETDNELNRLKEAEKKIRSRLINRKRTPSKRISLVLKSKMKLI